MDRPNATDPLILAIDQGTSNSKALLVAGDGRILLSRSCAMTVDYPRPGWVEQSADDIWTSVAGLIDALLAAMPGADIAAIAIANQRETILLWDAETGRPLAPAIIWQCQRSADWCNELRAQGLGQTVRTLSGLDIDPLFPAAKLAMLLDSVPGARDRAALGELRCGTVDSWLLWKLTDGAVHATDHGNASRTQLFNLATGEWNSELARMFDVPMNILPRIMASDACFGSTAAAVTALPAGIPIRCMMGDSHAALYAHSRIATGAVKATIGTGSSLMAATDARIHSSHGLSATIAWSRSDGHVQHAIEGNISVSGHAAAFARTMLGLPDEQALTALALGVADSGGVVFVPALAGLGAPHWQSNARGTISGMTLGTRPAHLARATIEAIALQIGDVLEAMAADLGQPLADLSIDGGGAGNDLLAQLLADVCGATILRPDLALASAQGAAMMAAETLGIARPRPAEAPARFVPTMRADQRLEMLHRWQQAVANVIAAGAMASD